MNEKNYLKSRQTKKWRFSIDLYKNWIFYETIESNLLFPKWSSDFINKEFLSYNWKEKEVWLFLKDKYNSDFNSWNSLSNLNVQDIFEDYKPKTEFNDFVFLPLQDDALLEEILENTELFYSSEEQIKKFLDKVKWVKLGFCSYYFDENEGWWTIYLCRSSVENNKFNWTLDENWEITINEWEYIKTFSIQDNNKSFELSSSQINDLLLSEETEIDGYAIITYTLKEIPIEEI